MRRDLIEAYDLPTDEEYEIQEREADTAIARADDCARRHRPVVYKTTEQPAPAPMRQPSVSREWVQDQLDVVIDVIAQETASDNEKISEAIKSLREQLATIRGEVDVLRGIARGEIKGIGIKGKTDAA